MESRAVNPWSWQDQFAFVQAREVSNFSKILQCSGQGSMDSAGKPLHLDDIAAQITQALSNVATLLASAGYQVADVSRLNCYSVDVDAFMSNYHLVADFIAGGQGRCAVNVFGVTRLALPELMVEFEVTAMR